LVDDVIDDIFDNAIYSKGLIKNRKTLSIDYVPEKLSFRDYETSSIAQTLSVILRGGRPSNLLIFGKPGTGKTAVIKNVIEHLRRKANDSDITLTVPLINAKNANTSYKILYEIAELMGINREEKKSQVHFTGLSMGEAAGRILDFIKRRNLNVVLIIDEIDSLVDKNGDDLLYNFTRANERISSDQFVSLIGISNSLTFKEKLDPRVRSSLSEEEVVFNPYTVEQLKHILSERCKIAFNDHAVSIGTINLCAAIAGKESGDARKAIDLLRVAAETAESERSLLVEEKHVRFAQQKIEKDTNFEIIRNSTTHTKIIIVAIIRSKSKNTGNIYETYCSLCSYLEQEPLTRRRITQLITELDQLGLVTTELINQGRYGRSQKIELAIPVMTVSNALKDDPIITTDLVN
jgi:cell division control protein 6